MNGQKKYGGWVFFFCMAPWLLVLVLMLGFLMVSNLGWLKLVIPNLPYQWARGIGTFVILVLTACALKLTFKCIDHPSKVWHWNPFLVSMVAFWALFPPSWFFLEHALFEHGLIALFNGESCEPHCPSDICESELTRLDTYAGLASKIWAGMAATFAVAIGLSKGKASSG